MNEKCAIVALAILVLCGVTAVKANSETQGSRPKLGDDVIDIDDQNDGQTADLTATTTDDDDLQDGSGSGMGDGADGDDEDLVAGSGHGSTYPPDFVESLTPCQQLHKSSLHLKDSYVPRCTKTGEYRKLQCRATTECFCVDPQGSIIQGTSKTGEMTDIRRQPDCDGGNNLKPCVHMQVEALWNQYISYSPSCTRSGEFKAVQCDKHNCWCVDQLGVEIGNSRVTSTSNMSKPDCTASTSVIRGGYPTEATTEKSTKKKHHKHKNNKHKTGHAYDPSVDIDSTKEPPYIYGDNLDHHDDIDDEMNFEGEFVGEENTSLEPDPKAQKKPTTIMAQPGILAGIIGGAVVGLLCAILLIMFIVYRMRKKDEGSYALDEPTKARGAYAYQKAPSKEFYA